MEYYNKNQVPRLVREAMEEYGFPYAQIIEQDKYEGEAYEVFFSDPSKEKAEPTGLPVIVVVGKDGTGRVLSPDESYDLLVGDK